MDKIKWCVKLKNKKGCEYKLIESSTLFGAASIAKIDFGLRGYEILGIQKTNIQNIKRK